LMGIVSCAFNICHEKSLRVQRIISLEIEAGAILPAKILGVNPLAREAMLADSRKKIFLLVLYG
jgi:hypothetical protein